nr:hypothetical protein OG296_33760 [Streptomyces sp. NBC_01001]
MIGCLASARTLTVVLAGCSRSTEAGSCSAISAVTTATEALVFSSAQAHIGRVLVAPPRTDVST